MNSPAPAPAKAPIGSLRALWPFVHRHLGLFTGWLLALACSSAATLSLPVAFRTMIDDGFSSGANIDRTFGFVLVVILVLALATAVRFFFVTMLGERVVADLRGRLYAHLLTLDAGFYDRSRTGELVSRLTTDAELLRMYQAIPAEHQAMMQAYVDGINRAVAAQFREQHPVSLAECQDIAVTANRESLEQVLVHLVQNAVDASPAGAPVFLRVACAGLGGVIEVLDSGTGMSPEFIRTRLFKPFVSLKDGGFGIGAFEARELVRAMGGRLEVQSREGLGTRFAAVLPLSATLGFVANTIPSDEVA